MKYKKPIIIIGGGVMGTSIAKRFLHNDFEVHLFNRFSKSRFEFIAEEIKKQNYCSNFFLHENFLKLLLPSQICLQFLLIGQFPVTLPLHKNRYHKTL